MQDLLVTFFHTVCWRGTVFVEKRGCREAHDMQFFFRPDQIGQGELVIDLVVGVGIQDHVDRTGGNIEVAHGSCLLYSVRLQFGPIVASITKNINEIYWRPGDSVL